MVDQELLQAFAQMLDTRLVPLQQAQKEIQRDLQELKDAQTGMELRLGQIETKLGQMETRQSKAETDLNGVKILLEVDTQRTLNLLLEGQQNLDERMPNPEQYQGLKTRMSALELAVKHHSWEIQALQRA